MALHSAHLSDPETAARTKPAELEVAMKDLVKRNQFVALLAGLIVLTLIDEVVLSFFMTPEDQLQAEALFKLFSRFLLLLSSALGFLLFIGYKSRKKQAQILQEERDKSRQLAARLASHKLGIDAHAIVSITDKKGRITYTNNKFREISGYSEEELLGENHRILNSGVHDRAFFEEMYKTVWKGESWTGEICNKAKNGTLYWVTTTIVPIMDTAGKLEEIISIRTDITDIKKKEAELKSYSELLKTTIENFPGGISVFDAKQRLLLANKSFYDLMEVTPDQFPVGKIYADVLREELQSGAISLVGEALSADGSFRPLTLDKKPKFTKTLATGREIEIESWPLEDGSIVATYYDVTEHKAMLKNLSRRNAEAEASAAQLLAAQQAQEQAHKRLIASINSMRGGFALWDKDANLVTANEAYKNYHKELAHLICPGMSVRDFLKAGHEIGFWNWKQELPDNWLDIFVERFKTADQFEATFETIEGRHLILYSTRLPNGDITSNFIDVTEERLREAELVRARDALSHIAYFDALTTLPNRARGQRDLEALFTNKQPHTRFAIIQIDLDKFKRVNDTLGHISGDHLLKEIGSRLAFLASKVPSFQPYRWGGDEFVAIVNDVTSAELESLCQELTDLIAIPVPYENSTLWPTVSLGVAIYPDDASDLSSLMVYADLALYKTKEMGRDGYQFFSSEMKERLDSEISIEADVRHALKMDEFELHFQPQISTIDESITGIEALVRWNHPKRGQLPPSLFMDIVEANGMASALGKTIFEKAMWSARQWIDEGLSFGRLSVNLSPAHLQRKTLVDDFLHSMEKYNINPDLLAVELLEGVLLDDQYTNIYELFDTLSARGVHVELDDFGTGYASLSHLSSLPIDGIKIDRSFVNNIVVNKKQKAIVEVVMSMSRLMQLRVVCEGIETHQQLSTVSQIANCSVQGYLVSRPLSFGDMTRWIREKRNIGLLTPPGPRKIRKSHMGIASSGS